MKTQNASFTKMFGAHSHCINEQKQHIIMPKALKCCLELASNDSFSMMQYSAKLSQVSLSTTRKVINCLPLSKSEVELGTETTGISESVRVKFQLEKQCEFGDSFLIVGDDPILGSWNPSDAILFNWSEGHIWSLLLDLPVEKSIQYKILLKKRTGEILWQPGSDRSFQAWETKNVISVTEEWDNAEAQKISEEQKIEKFEEPSALNSPEDSNEEHLSSASSHVEVLGSDENTSAEHKNEAHLKVNLSSSVVKKGKSSDKNAQKKVVALKEGNEQRVQGEQISAEAEEEGNLVIDDEGPVLVPGLTLLVSSSEEARAKEKQKPVPSEN